MPIKQITQNKYSKQRNNLTLDIIIPAWNAEATILRLLFSIEEQVVKTDQTTVWIVDDASTDKTCEVVNNFSSEHYKLNLIHLTTNGGRAKAKNTGANNGTGRALLFIDSDCFFKNPESLQKLVAAYSDGKQICFGRLEDDANDFWAAYFNKSQKKKNHNNLDTFSTTNMLCSREIFTETGGFYEEYSHYGFEDRDLILRMLSFTNTETEVAYIEGAKLSHEGNDSLASYCQKQFESGKFSSAIFSERFPEHYQKMNYRKVDAAHCGKLKQTFLGALTFLCPALIKILSKIITVPTVPNIIKIILAQSVAAISYYDGTKHRETQSKLNAS